MNTTTATSLSAPLSLCASAFAFTLNPPATHSTPTSIPPNVPPIPLNENAIPSPENPASTDSAAQSSVLSPHPSLPHFLSSSSRSDNVLAQLPPEDQQTLLNWFHQRHAYAKIVQLAAQPRSQGGLDLKISPSQLSRYHHKRHLAERIALHAELIQDLCPATAQNPEAACALLAEHHALETLSSPDLDHAAFQQIARYLSRLQSQRTRERALDLQQKRLAFHMQQHQNDILRDLKAKLPELLQELEDEKLPLPQRLRKQIDAIFGMQWKNTIDNANTAYRQNFPDADHTAAEPTSNPEELLLKKPLSTTDRTIKVAQFFGIDYNRPKPNPTPAPAGNPPTAPADREVMDCGGPTPLSTAPEHPSGPLAPSEGERVGVRGSTDVLTAPPSDSVPSPQSSSLFSHLDLVAICRRNRVHPPATRPFTAPEVLAVLQTRYTELQHAEARACTSHSADYIEWKQLTDTIRQDIAQLQSHS